MLAHPWITILSGFRQVVWECADSECHIMPSTEALKLHWTRSLWVLEMWHQATLNKLNLPGIFKTLSSILGSLYVHVSMYTNVHNVCLHACLIINYSPGKLWMEAL